MIGFGALDEVQVFEMEDNGSDAMDNNEDNGDIFIEGNKDSDNEFNLEDVPPIRLKF